MSENHCTELESNESKVTVDDVADIKDHRVFIETILVEMKSEFNRNLVIEEGKDDGEESSVSKSGKFSTKNEQLETKSEKKCKPENKIKDDRTSETEAPDADEKRNTLTNEDNANEIAVSLSICKDQVEKAESLSICKDQVEAEDLEISKIPENSTKIVKQVQVAQELMKVPSPKKSKSTVETANVKNLPENPGEDGKLSSQAETPKGKRSLRSQTLVKAPPQKMEEPLGVKRSARRQSKDLPRESVLQSAIARKEKSFSNLSHPEEKSGPRNFRARVHRSPRMSSGESGQPVNRSSGTTHTKSSQSENVVKPAASKLPKTSIHEADDESNLKPDIATDHSDNPKEASSVDATESTVKTSSDSCSKSPSQATVVNCHSYTKTGKRRYKPYRGLRYSFTSGPVKKNKLTKRQFKNSLEVMDDSSIVKNEVNASAIIGEKLKDILKPDVEESFTPEAVAITNADSQMLAQTGEKDGIPEEVAENTDTCHPAALKRAVSSDDHKCGDSKVMRMNLSPSPVPADVPQPEVVPEAGNIPSGARTASLCLCQVESRVYVKIEESDMELYCQAVDSVDEHSIGCYNAIQPGEVCMLRASTALQYQLLCDVHRQRLLRHNCCAGCGMFCTQGRFVLCSSQHLYHRSCSRMIEQASVCPHCGAETPATTDFLITMQAAKNPVFLPQQKSAVKFPHAKISFGGSFSSQQAEASEQRSPSPPLVPTDLLHVSAHSEGIPMPLDKDKLDHLLSVSSSMLEPGMNPALAQRYTVKSLYQAAKVGNTEKLITVLGAGLNPNHMFRECQMGSALHLACWGGHLAAVHVLVQAGAQLDLLDREQNTPLMLAVLEGHTAVVKYLVKAGASVTHKGSDGMTPLHLAAKAGHLEVCRSLLSVPNLPRGYINSLDEGRWTALVWAAEHKHADVVRFLLEKRADPLIRDAEQNIALHWSAFSGSVAISEMLLNHGADINASNTHGDTPLHIGARQNMYDCVVLLLARGAKTDMRNRQSKAPLDCCFSSAEDAYKAINLNVVLQTIVRNYNKQPTRILCNDISAGKEINPIQCINWEDDAGKPTDYLYVKENCFTSSIDMDRTITSLHSCLCQDSCTTELCMCARFSMGIWYDDNARLLPGFNYADPPMLFECNQRCSCNQLMCKNRVMQNGMTVRLQLFRTPCKGWGVQTLRPIPKGSYVCEYVGEIISDSEADHREDDSYLFDLENKDGETYCIDARDYGNVTRFINHMCLPNLTSVRVFVEHQDLHFPRIALFANRDIEANEELGYDYGEKFWIIKCKSFTCMCGAGSCRYSEATIQQTLDDYKKRVHEAEMHVDILS